MKQHAAKKPAKTRPRKMAAPEIKPLSLDEYTILHNLLSEAHGSNIRLVNRGSELADARLNLSRAETALNVAETDMAAERVRNSNIHAQLAPLLHRLPVVEG